MVRTTTRSQNDHRDIAIQQIERLLEGALHRARLVNGQKERSAAAAADPKEARHQEIEAQVREIMAKALGGRGLEHYDRRCAEADVPPDPVVEFNIRRLAEDIAYTVPFVADVDIAVD